MAEDGVDYPKREIPSVKTTELYEVDSIAHVFAKRSEVGPGYPVVQISEHHGRALVDERSKGAAVWTDEYGIIYGSRDWKGALLPDFQAVVVEEDSTSSYGLRVPGLLDYTTVEEAQRTVLASKALRAIGIPTEMPAKINKVEELIYNQEKLPAAEVIELYLQRRRGELQAITDPILLKAEEAKLAKEEKYLRSVDFYIVERYLQVPERLRDLMLCSSEEQLLRALSSVFRWLNVVFKSRETGLIPNSVPPEPFDISKREDIVRYFTHYLPDLIGASLGRLHMAGLVHGNLHDQNWSAAGTMLDLQTVRGSQLGDDPVTEKDCLDEVAHAGRLINTILYRYSLNLSYNPVEAMFNSNHLANRVAHFIDFAVPREEIFVILASAYLRERFKNLLDSQEPEARRDTIKEKARQLHLYSVMIPPPIDRGMDHPVDLEALEKEWQEQYRTALDRIADAIG